MTGTLHQHEHPDDAFDSVARPGDADERIGRLLRLLAHERRAVESEAALPDAPYPSG